MSKIEGDIQSIKSDLKWFLLLSLGLSFIIGVIIIVYRAFEIEQPIMGMALVMMIIPAGAVAIIKRYINKEDISEGMNKIFGLTLITLLSGILMIMIVPIFSYEAVEFITTIGLLIVSIIGMVIMLKHKDDFKETVFNIKRNMGKGILIIFIFLGLNVILVFILNTMGHYEIILGDIPKIILSLILFVSMNLLIGWFPFYGEEFGWRGYMQPRLQRLYGKRSGVIIGGVIWGIWHIPLCIKLYEGDILIGAIIKYLFFCVGIGVFLGYGYMKTRNIWLVIVIHGINNSIQSSIEAVYGKPPVTGLVEELLIGGIMILIYGVFILSKEYRVSREEIEIDI